MYPSSHHKERKFYLMGRYTLKGISSSLVYIHRFLLLLVVVFLGFHSPILWVGLICAHSIFLKYCEPYQYQSGILEIVEHNPNFENQWLLIWLLLVIQECLIERKRLIYRQKIGIRISVFSWKSVNYKMDHVVKERYI